MNLELAKSGWVELSPFIDWRNSKGGGVRLEYLTSNHVPHEMVWGILKLLTQIDVDQQQDGGEW